MLLQSTEETIVIALDLETTIRAGANSEKLGGATFELDGTPLGTNRPPADPFHMSNEVVLAGWSYLGKDGAWFTTETGSMSDFFDYLCRYLFTNNTKNIILVGVNIGFDYSYLLNFINTPASVPALPDHYNLASVESLLQDSYLLWDLSIVEYYLSGQTSKYPSMKRMAEKYKLPIAKGDLAKKYWDKQIDTTHIPTVELESYLYDDVLITSSIYSYQFNDILTEMKVNPNFGRLLYDNMVGRSNTIVMAKDMFALDTTLFKELVKDKEDEVVLSEHFLKKYLIEYLFSLGAPVEVLKSAEDNYTSPTFMKFITYGCKVPYETSEIVMVNGKPKLYKSGKKKGQPYRKKTTAYYAGHTYEIDNSNAISDYIKKGKDLEYYHTITGNLKIDADTLKRYIERADKILRHNMDVCTILGCYLDYKDALKESTTYGVGLLKNLPVTLPVTANSNNDSILTVATDYNHTTTATTRLSSSKINVQNLKGG